MTRQTRDIDGGSGGVFYQRVGERFSSREIMQRVTFFLQFFREATGHTMTVDGGYVAQ